MYSCIYIKIHNVFFIVSKNCSWVFLTRKTGHDYFFQSILYSRIIVSKSRGDTSMYVDTVINLVKLTTYIHIHTTYYIHTE